MTDDHHLPAPRDLPERAGQTTAECPWPVRLLSSKMSEYIARMSPVWIEGQVVELNRRTGSGMAFLTLRDIDAEISLPVHIYARDLPDPEVLREGAHVVVHTKANFWEKSGRLSMHVREVRAIGVGELLKAAKDANNRDVNPTAFFIAAVIYLALTFLHLDLSEIYIQS